MTPLDTSAILVGAVYCLWLIGFMDIDWSSVRCVLQEFNVLGR